MSPKSDQSPEVPEQDVEVSVDAPTGEQSDDALGDAIARARQELGDMGEEAEETLPDVSEEDEPESHATKETVAADRVAALEGKLDQLTQLIASLTQKPSGDETVDIASLGDIPIPEGWDGIKPLVAELQKRQLEVAKQQEATKAELAYMRAANDRERHPEWAKYDKRIGELIASESVNFSGRGGYDAGLHAAYLIAAGEAASRTLQSQKQAAAKRQEAGVLRKAPQSRPATRDETARSGGKLLSLPEAIAKAKAHAIREVTKGRNS